MNSKENEKTLLMLPQSHVSLHKNDILIGIS
jgi:hypothetical protein